MEQATPRKPSNGNGSRPSKESLKDSSKKSLSQKDGQTPTLEEEREKLEKKVRQLFPHCLSIPKGIPTEKLFLFVYRISQGEIRSDSIGSPVAYMKGMLAEDVTPLLEKLKEDARIKAEKADRAREDTEAREKFREENGEEIAQLIREFRMQLEGEHAVGV